ncbi:hypothetical protein [Amycolatopsis cihanbeyliensis]|uniref:Uncharacterized protein n=1 Tax=Amycolatopsis cihanbeyliensis TaxID=1128664 RepID=A0A542DCE3_AMYCI|nr:hypothetical protein [Amycolatopsis cihanbeyliensis]TQJ00739.1 hypothetical protein FB471_0388 [Amycolatopsis cihanbeyliensis]
MLPAAAPERLRVLRLDGRRSVEQIVDGYGIECQPVRDLLVEYLTERSPELDHTSLSSIARWAADDPARWARWVVPCPIKAAEVTLKKANSRVKARMDQRTRTRLPLLPALLRAAERQRKDAEAHINTAGTIAAGGRFTAGGQEFQRCRQGGSGRVYAVDLATDRRRDLTHEESAAFWSWVTVEVLRHNGIRIEEMLEHPRPTRSGYFWSRPGSGRS